MVADRLETCHGSMQIKMAGRVVTAIVIISLGAVQHANASTGSGAQPSVHTVDVPLLGEGLMFDVPNGQAVFHTAVCKSHFALFNPNLRVHFYQNLHGHCSI